MKNDKKTFVKEQTHALSCLAIIVAIGANVLMFCILALARTTPLLSHPEEYESIHIISLDLPAPTSAEPTDQETIMDVVQLGTESTDPVLPEPVAEITSSAFPRLAERIQDVTLELPGLTISHSDVSLMIQTENTSISAVGEPTSAPKVDRLPLKIAGPLPQYPQWARRDNLEAVVTLRFIVTTEGTVEDVNIHEIEGDERFGREAVQAVSQWHFRPAIRAGKSAACWCFQKITFKLNR